MLLISINATAIMHGSGRGGGKRKRGRGRGKVGGRMWMCIHTSVCPKRTPQFMSPFIFLWLFSLQVFTRRIVSWITGLPHFDSLFKVTSYDSFKGPFIDGDVQLPRTLCILLRWSICSQFAENLCVSQIWGHVPPLYQALLQAQGNRNVPCPQKVQTQDPTCPKLENKTSP